MISLLFDAGLFVLIWMVQLVIYPSFLYFEKENLVKWHHQYTKGLSMIVIPLMLGQLCTTIVQLVQFSSIEISFKFILVCAVWVLTFLHFVPIHNQISNRKATYTLLNQLVHRNWLRTLLWTVILCCNLYFTSI